MTEFNEWLKYIEAIQHAKSISNFVNLFDIE